MPTGLHMAPDYDLYFCMVEGALDSNCKWRRSGKSLRKDGSAKEFASLQIPDWRTSKK